MAKVPILLGLLFYFVVLIVTDLTPLSRVVSAQDIASDAIINSVGDVDGGEEIVDDDAGDEELDGSSLSDDEGDEERPSEDGISPRLDGLPAAAEGGVREGSGERSEQTKCYTCDSKAGQPVAAASDTGIPAASLVLGNAGDALVPSMETCCDATREDQLKVYIAPAGYQIYCYTLYDSVYKERVVSRGAEFLNEPRESGCFRSLGDQHMCMCKGSDGCNDDVTVDNGARCKRPIPYNNGALEANQEDESVLVIFDPNGDQRVFDEPDSDASRDANGASAVGSASATFYTSFIITTLIAFLT